MDRAYSILNVKGMTDDADFVYIEGIASTPTVDRQGDVVDPAGAKFVTPMPLLWQHDAHKPVGHMTFAQPTKSGIPFRAQIPKIAEAGTLKDRVDEAIQSLKYGLVSAVSIGFKIMEDGYEVMKGGGWSIKKWEWLELSLVTIPANSEALISSVKAIDSAALSAIGRKQGEEVAAPSPGDAGKPKATRRPIQIIPRVPIP
jgi:HK97 family phage prohead protease